MPVFEALIGPVLQIVDKIIPDPEAKAKAQLELLKLQQAGEFKQLDADLQIMLRKRRSMKRKPTRKIRSAQAGDPQSVGSA